MTFIYITLKSIQILQGKILKGGIPLKAKEVNRALHKLGSENVRSHDHLKHKLVVRGVLIATGNQLKIPKNPHKEMSKNWAHDIAKNLLLPSDRDLNLYGSCSKGLREYIAHLQSIGILV